MGKGIFNGAKEKAGEAGGKGDSAKAAGAYSGAGAGAAGTAGSGEEGKQTEKSSEKTLVTDEQQKRFEERKKAYEKKKAEREKAGLKQGKPEQTAAVVKTVVEGEVPEKKKRKKSAKKKDTGISAAELDKLFLPLSEAIASRPNMSHWKMDEQEVHSITEPLAEVLNKLAPVKAMNGGAEFSLIIAVIAVFAPRIFLTIKIKKENKKYGKTSTTDTSTGTKLDGNRKSKTIRGGSSKEVKAGAGRANEQLKPDGETNRAILLDGAIPAIG